MTTEYISCKDTAVIVRRILKEKFPGMKFGVTSETYAGGASIDVRWMLGPTTKEVDHAVKWLEGAGFDGMIDLKYHNQHWMKPDGTIGLLSSEGTEGSLGVVAPVKMVLPDGAKAVHFGADYITTARTYVKDWHDETAWRERIARDMCALQGVEFKSLNTRNLFGDTDEKDLQDHIWQLLDSTSFKIGENYQGLRYASQEEREKNDHFQVFVVLK